LLFVIYKLAYDLKMAKDGPKHVVIVNRINTILRQLCFDRPTLSPMYEAKVVEEHETHT